MMKYLGYVALVVGLGLSTSAQANICHQQLQECYKRNGQSDTLCIGIWSLCNANPDNHRDPLEGARLYGNNNGETRHLGNILGGPRLCQIIAEELGNRARRSGRSTVTWCQ